MAAGGALDLNAATFDELCSVPGVGPALARRVVSLRQQRGRIESLDELLEVEGVTPGLLSRLRPYLTVIKTSPADPVPESDPSDPAPSPQPEPQVAEEEQIPTQGAPEPRGSNSLPNEDSAPGDGHGSMKEPSPMPDAARPNPPRSDSLFDDDGEWPRSYGGVSSSILFGEPDPAQDQTPPPPYRSRAGARALGVGRAILLVLLGALLGTALSLAGLTALNGSLFYASRDHVEQDISVRLDALEADAQAQSDRLDRMTAQVGSAQAQIESAQGALEELDESLAELGVRVAEVEGLRDQVETTVAEIGMLANDVSALEEDLAEVSASTDRFGDFLEALRQALAETAE